MCRAKIPSGGLVGPCCLQSHAVKPSFAASISFQGGSSRHTRKVKSCPPGARLSFFQHCTRLMEGKAPSPSWILQRCHLQHLLLLSHPSPAAAGAVPTLCLLMGTSGITAEHQALGGGSRKGADSPWVFSWGLLHLWKKKIENQIHFSLKESIGETDTTEIHIPVCCHPAP